jgi:hypothetical protein
MHVVVEALLEDATAEIVGLSKGNCPIAFDNALSEMRAFFAALANQAVLNTRSDIGPYSTKCYIHQDFNRRAMPPPIPDSEFGQQARPVLQLRRPLVSNVHCRLYKKRSSARRHAPANAR